MTADTSNGTCTHDILALVFGTALYEVHCLIWYKFNQMLRTCSHAFATGFADLRIDFCNTIYDMDRIKRTCFHTISKSQTSIIAGLWSAIWNKCHCRTIFHSGILVILFCFLTGSGTLDKSDFFYRSPGRNTHDLANLCGNRLSTDWTLIDRCLSLCDCRSKSGTSGISTATTVISRENF